MPSRDEHYRRMADETVDKYWNDHRTHLPEPTDGPHVPTLEEVYSFMADFGWDDKARLWRMKRDLKWIFRKAQRAGKEWQWPWPKKS